MILDEDEDDLDDGRKTCEFCGRAMWFVGGAWRCVCGEDDEEDEE